MNKLKKKISTIRPTFATIILLMVFIGLGGTTYALTQASRTINTKQAPTFAKETLQKTKSLSPTASTASAISTPVPSPSTQSPRPVQSTPKPVKPSTSNDPPPEVFRVLSVIASAGSYCDVSSTNYRVGLLYAYINTNTYPGVARWQVEARQYGAISVVGSGVASMSMYQGAYEVKNPQNYYVAVLPQADTALRFHVVSPVDMTSQWFTAESMSAESPCARE